MKNPEAGKIIPGMLALFFLPVLCWAEFGVNGIATTSIGTGDVAFSLIMQPDGKLVAAGTDSSWGDFVLIRYDNHGSLDTGFNGTGKVITPIGSYGDTARALVVQPDGKLVAAGYSITNNYAGYSDFALVRYQSNGTLDPNFGAGGKVTTQLGAVSLVTSLVSQPDGKLVAAGRSNSNFALVRYNSNGSLDASFGTDGKVVPSLDASVNSLVLQPDGKLVAGGYSGDDFCLIRFNSNGSLDTSFGTDGKVVTPLGTLSARVNSLILQPDGKLAAAGYYGGSHFALVRYNGNGSLDTSFGIGGIVTTQMGSNDNQAYSLVLQPDGKLVAAGYSYNASNKEDFRLVRYNANGSLDATFGSDGIVTTPIGNDDDEAFGIALQPDGKLVAAGFSSNDNINDFSLVRYNSNGSLDTQNDPPVMLEIIKTYGLAGSTVILDIRGWNLDGLLENGVQLRNSSGTIFSNGQTQLITNTRVTAAVTLPAEPGWYDLYLAKPAINKIFKSAFCVQTPLQLPVHWQVEDLGKSGNPLTGPSGVAIGDVNSDGKAELVVANFDDKVFMYRKEESTWGVTPFAPRIGQFQDVSMLDMDLDGQLEILAANTKPEIMRYSWSNNNGWEGNSVAACSGVLTNGFLAGGGLVELYALSSSRDLGHMQYIDQTLASTMITQNGRVLCSVVGDGDNDRLNEVYAAFDSPLSGAYSIVQLKYRDNQWRLETNVSAQQLTKTTSLAIGDVDNDGTNELYGGRPDGKIVQYKWAGSSWVVGLTTEDQTLVANKLAMGDGDNDGTYELYAACQDGHVYRIKEQFGGKPPHSKLYAQDLGSANTPLIALAVGDGDNSHQCEVYAVGENKHVYQFQAVHISATPTRTPTCTCTPGNTPIVTATPTFTLTPTVMPTAMQTSTSTATPCNTAVPESEKRLKIYNGLINPLKNEQAQIQWYQFSAEQVKIAIYNLLGERVAGPALHTNYSQGQIHAVYWNGKTDQGAVVGSGIYIVCLEAGAYKTRSKIAVIK